MASRTAKNVLANWLALGTATVIGFFLTPYVLHQLGDTGFGLWVLVTTLTGYYGLLDFGFRNSTIRFVARYAATSEAANVGRVVSTTLFTYSILGVLVLAVSVAIAWNVDRVLAIPGEWTRTARLLLLLFGVGTALGFPLNLFGHVLEGLQRFTWIGVVQAGAIFLRAALTVWVLRQGCGVVAVGIVTIATNLVGSAIYAIAAPRIYPALRVRWAYVEHATFRTLAGFGVVTFWIGIAQILRFQADAVVIGSFLSVQAISHFSIASKLVMYITEVVQAMAEVFTPLFSHFDARGDLRQLGSALVKVNRSCSLLAFPLAAFFVAAGKSLIVVWVGSQYLASYPILVVLTVPTALYLAQAGSPKVMYGMARHSVLAQVLLLEGLANVVLSIVLLRWYGVLGVALGTAIPLALTSLCVLPVYVCWLLELRLPRYLWEAHGYPLLLSFPLALFLWEVDGWLNPADYQTLVAEFVLGVVFYGGELLALLYYTQGLKELSVFWAKLSERSVA